MSLSRQIPVAPELFRLVPGEKGGVTFVNAAPAPAKPREPDLEAVRREAFAAGQAQARAECEAKTASRHEWIRNFEARFDSYLDRLERQAGEQSLELAVRLAEILLRHSLPDREMLRAVMTEALDPFASSGSVKVRMHPEDAAVFTGGEGMPPSLVGRIELVPDSSLVRGDMMMEDGFGLLDARVSERVELLRTKLRERFKEAYANGHTI